MSNVQLHVAVFERNSGTQCASRYKLVVGYDHGSFNVGCNGPYVDGYTGMHGTTSGKLDQATAYERGRAVSRLVTRTCAERTTLNTAVLDDIVHNGIIPKELQDPVEQAPPPAP